MIGLVFHRHRSAPPALRPRPIPGPAGRSFGSAAQDDDDAAQLRTGLASLVVRRERAAAGAFILLALAGAVGGVVGGVVGELLPYLA
jgi:hypothetical protein